MPFPRGGIPWNRGLTKESDTRVANYGKTGGEARKGRIPWNKGRKGIQVPWNKGIKGIPNPKVSIALKGRQLPVEVRQKMSEAHKGVPKPMKIRQKISTSQKGKVISIESRKRMSETWKFKLSHNPETNPFYGKHHSQTTKERISQAKKEQWRDPEFVRKQLIAMQVRPNRLEQKLENILNRNFPNEWQYTGNGNLVINGMIPDFANCNGRKDLIEVFGDFWHSDDKTTKGYGPLAWQDTELGKIMAYNNLGYRCLVIWQHELDALSESQIVRKIKSFSSKGRHVRSV